MKKPWVYGAAAAAIVLALLITALTLAFAGNDDDGDSAQAATPSPTQSPAAATSTPAATAQPTTTPPAVTATSVPATSAPPQSTATVTPVNIPPPPTPTAPAGTRIVPAPIESITVLVRESSPPQYGLSAKVGLPGGCAKQHGATLARNDANYTVEVTNTLPTGNVPCTLIYGTYEINISLPGPFVSGTTYTVNVNDKQTTFRAQ